MSKKNIIHTGKNRRLEVRMGTTINMGDYESLRLDVGMAVDLPDGADDAQAYEDMCDYLADEIDKNTPKKGGK